MLELNLNNKKEYEWEIPTYILVSDIKDWSQWEVPVEVKVAVWRCLLACGIQKYPNLDKCSFFYEGPEIDVSIQYRRFPQEQASFSLIFNGKEDLFLMIEIGGLFKDWKIIHCASEMHKELTIKDFLLQAFSLMEIKAKVIEPFKLIQERKGVSTVEAF